MTNYNQLFTRMYKTRPTPEGLIFDDIPEKTRIGIFHIIFSIFGNPYRGYSYYQHLYQEICGVLRIRWDWTQTHELQFVQAIEKAIMKCSWDDVYVICQIAYNFIKGNTSRNSNVLKPGAEERFQAEINGLFQDEFLGFTLKDGTVERTIDPITAGTIRESRVLLKQPEFVGADQHFEKAVKNFNMVPKPDVENCIRDAVASIESAGRVIMGDEKALLSDIIKTAVKRGVIPKPLDQAFQSIYAYRGNEPALGHGAVDLSKVTVDEAELILGFSAAMIIYLVKKREQLS